MGNPLLSHSINVTDTYNTNTDTSGQWPLSWTVRNGTSQSPWKVILVSPGENREISQIEVLI